MIPVCIHFDTARKLKCGIGRHAPRDCDVRQNSTMAGCSAYEADPCYGNRADQIDEWRDQDWDKLHQRFANTGGA